MDTQQLLGEIARGNVIALVPAPGRVHHPTDESARPPARRWYSCKEVAEMLGFGLYKVKDLVIRREIRSVKIGKYRRILPEWVDEFIARTVDDQAA